MMIKKEILLDAEYGDTKAQLKVGSAYVEHQDFDKAFYWLNKAAQQDDAEAQDKILQLAVKGMGKIIDEAIDDEQFDYWYYKREAEKGDVKAQYNLGEAYQLGQGVSQDIKIACHWFRKAAESGHTEAQFSLGLIYELENDGKQAALCFKEAAKNNHAAAQVHLAMLYISGVGVLKSMKDAAYWLKLAHANDNSKAKDLWNAYELWNYE